MNADSIARLLMVLTGFVLAMLGVIIFVHSGEHQMLGILTFGQSDHNILGIIISFAGVMSMFGGLPDNA